MPIYDVHAHAIVPSALQAMQRAHPDFSPMLTEDEGRKFLAYPGRERLGPLPDAIFDPLMRRDAMDGHGVDVQVIAVPPPNFHYHVPPGPGIDFARIQNDALLALSDSEPDRFHVFATLPLQDIDASLRELARVAEHSRVRGIEVGTFPNGHELDDPAFAPLWAEAQSKDLPIWVHPDQRTIAGADRLSRYYLQNLIGNPLESTIAIAALIFGGVVAAHPLLRFGFVHGGGFAPYQIGRWDHGWEVRGEPKRFLPDTYPRELFTRLFFDSLTHDPRSLDLLGRQVGWEQVVLGSDYPFDMASRDPVRALEAAELPAGTREAVLESNPERLLRPLAGR